MTPTEAKQKLIDAGLVLEAEGHHDMTRGHISVRVPGNPELFYMKPHSYGFDEMTMDNIVTCNIEGEKVDGNAPRHSEVYIHSEIFRARPDVMSVIHSHPDNAVAVSASGRPIRAWSQPSVLFVNEVGYFTETIDLIRRKDQGAGVARALGPHRVCLMKNHGVAMAGASIEDAVISAIMLENACRIQMLVEAAGDPAPEFPPDDLQLLKDKIGRHEQMVINFDYLVRKVKRRQR
ncbi:MAG: class II aldolase/adducin family protein [Hyphomicrobiaceae bacterium]